MAGNRLRASVIAGDTFSSARFVSHMRTPLYRNGYLLTLNGFLTSGLGILYWILAARSYSATTLGLNSAALSAMILLSGMAQLSLNGVMIRFIPRAGRATKRLVIYSYLISAITAAVISVIFLLGLGLWLPGLRHLADTPAFLLSFVLATMVWCIFSLQDSVMAGLRQTMWIPIENTTFAILKIGLLIAFSLSFKRYGIFSSWTIPVAMSLIPINVLIFRYLIPKHAQEAGLHAATIAPRQVLRYVAGNYFGSLFFLASTTLLPIIVTDKAGASANAHFYLPWQVCISLQLVAVNMTASLTVEAARDEKKLAIYCYRVFIQTGRLLVPIVIVFLLGAPYLLRIFGEGYAREGTLLLQLLALSVIPNVVITLYISVARVKNRVRGIAVAQGLLCVLVLGLSYFCLPAFGVTGVGWAYLASQIIVAMLLIGTQMRPIQHVVRTASRLDAAHS